MARHTDGRPEEEFLTRAHQREAHADAGDLDEEPTVEIVVNQDDLRDRGLAPPERDDRVPPWWRFRHRPVGTARPLVLGVLAVFLISLVTIGIWTLATGSLPPYEEHQPSPQALPGAEDIAEPGRESEF